jgi:cytochrome c2
MEEDSVYSINQASCNHSKQQHYSQKDYDLLNGYEFVFTKCMNCHKILCIDAKKMVTQ